MGITDAKKIIKNIGDAKTTKGLNWRVTNFNTISMTRIRMTFRSEVWRLISVKLSGYRCGNCIIFMFSLILFYLFFMF